jgi:hypothetical protein
MLSQLDLFAGAVTATSTSVAGLVITLPRACATCGAVDATIGASKAMHHAQINCSECNRHRGWLRGETYGFITSVIDTFGRPTDPITVTFKNSRTSADNTQ